MAPHKTVTVNGRIYDAVTGLPINVPPAPREITKKPSTSPVPKAVRPAGTPRPDVVKIASKVKSTAPPVKKAAPLAPRSTVASASVHGSLQHSQTLNRRATKKPIAPNRPITKRPTTGRQMDMAKSADVSRFAKNPMTAPKPVKPAAPSTPNKPAQAHPMVQRAFARSKARAIAPKAKPTTAKEVKDAAISKALATPKQRSTPLKTRKKNRRLIIIFSAVVLLLAMLFTAYRLFPGISVSIASAQAGLSATYPEFTPDGYALSQPVTYVEGQVTLKFHSNSNDNYYTVTQTRSSWDSSATLDNVVTPAVGADYVTTKERGLTIYTYKSIAVWVNGGILYEIDSKAPLSGDQIRRIAISL